MIGATAAAATGMEHRATRLLHEKPRTDRVSWRRTPRAPTREGRHDPVTFTEEGFPAATPDAPKPSPVVFVAEESRARYPWLPGRVIAGSVWHGPKHERVRVNQKGVASAWRRGPAQVRDGSWREVANQLGACR